MTLFRHREEASGSGRLGVDRSTTFSRGEPGPSFSLAWLGVKS